MPSGQGAQTDCAEAAANRPRAQSVQFAAVDVLKVPGLHIVHRLDQTPSSALAQPAGQFVQMPPVLLVVQPARKRPAAQTLQTSQAGLPCKLWCEPWTQAVQLHGGGDGGE